MASLVKVSASVFLFKLLLGLSLLFVSVIRINAVSGIYLLCLLALPLLASPTCEAHMRGAAGNYLRIVMVLSALGCVTQILYQCVLAGLGTYDDGSDVLVNCNYTDTVWRQLGYQRLDNLDALNVTRLVIPDVVLLIVSIIVFVSCKFIVQPPQPEQELDEHCRRDSPVIARRSRQTSVVVEGLRSCNIMIFCALSGIILPSAISAVYFATFLVVITWWSFYQTWGRVFKWIEKGWLFYSGMHLVVLYFAQFEYFQILTSTLDSGPDSRITNVIGFIGLTPIVNSQRCGDDLDPRVLVYNQDVLWMTYVNPAFVFLFYWFLGHEVHRWSAGPEYEEIVRQRAPKKKGKKSGKDEKQHLVSDDAGPSYNTMEPSQSQTADPAPDSAPGGGEESGYTSVDEGGVRSSHKMSAFTTFIGFLTKQSYIVGLIFMMAWSIIYLSWLTFVLLLGALLLWILPISSTRSRCLYTSPLLVLYAEAIIIITFIFGMDLQFPESYGEIDLKEVGLVHYDYPFVYLLVQLLFTLMFWLTLRQFLREQRLRRHNVDEGIVLQPFGVIFSGPEEEVSTFEEQGRGLRSRGQSATMTWIGMTTKHVLGKYWILLCGLMFLIISLQGTVDIFKIIYLLLFLVLMNIFELSFTIFRFILKPFAWIVVLYSIAVLCMIYTYQFSAFRYWWTNGTDITETELAVLGLAEYDNLGVLVKTLLIPTAFIILVMIQLHYFHDNFLTVSKIKKAGYRPGKLDGDGETEGRRKEEEGEETRIMIDEPDRASTSSSKKMSTKSKLKLRLMKAYSYFSKYLGPVQVFLWRLLEMHIMKLVFLTIVLVITREMTAVNGVLLLIILLPIVFPSLHHICCILSLLWVSMVILGKMLFQINFEVWVPKEDITSNCSEFPNFPIKDEFNITSWFGFTQVTDFYIYVEGYVAIIVMLILQSIVSLHQQQYRYQRGLVKPIYTTVFDDITRKSADQGLFHCIKFLLNYCFFKFGLEICFVTTVIVAAVRLDVFAFLYLAMMVPLLFVKRRTCALLWPFYIIGLLLLILIAYGLALGLPPVLCISYPWHDLLPERLVTWLYLSDYQAPPDSTVIVGDFFQLLFVSLQWCVFRHDARREIISGGGDNYESSVDVEEIYTNPVPNYTFNRSYLDVCKSLVYGYAFYVTLALVFLCGTLRTSILGFFYLIFAFYFLWYGPKFLTKPTEKVLKQWNFLIGYTLFVIFMKVALQIMACAYVDDIVGKNLCWIMQLFGVVCLQHDYTDTDVCAMPSDQARLNWDVTCFFFVVFQRRIFTSNYFLYIVIDLQEEERLASKGAELINEILAAKVRTKKLEEQRILQNVKRKMKRIKEKQAKLSKKNEYQEPTTHAEAIRAAAGYYMFEDEEEEELSDLEAEHEPTSPKNPLQLAFHGVMEDPKKALELDKERQAAIASGAEDVDDADADAVSYSTAISGEGGDKDRPDQKASLEEAIDDDDEVVMRGSDQDDIEMEQEEGAEGTCGKIMSALSLTWLIFLRSIDTLIKSLDGISEEYRYVARELLKLTSEGKRKRELRKQKRAAELQDMSCKTEEEEINTAEPEEAATGSTADENGQVKDARVSIVPQATSKFNYNAFLGSGNFDDSASMTETHSSEQFRRNMPRPVRLLYSTMYAAIAQSQLLCYFIIVLNQLLSASLLSLPLVLMVLLWAMLSVPRPTKKFWITVITYTEIIVLVKYLFQFQFYPWNDDATEEIEKSNPLWWPRVIGIEQKTGYAAVDLCILLAVFFHRSVLIRHGLWQESRVVPDLGDEDSQTSSLVAIGDGECDADGDQDETDRGKKQKKKRKKKKEKRKAKGAEGGARAEILLSSSDEERQLSVKDDQSVEQSLQSVEDNLSQLEDREKWYQPAINFYRNMIDPMYSAVTDVYVFIFAIQFILFCIIAFFSYAFGEESTSSDVAQIISSNTIPLSFLLLLLTMFFLIITDRAIYLCKDVKAKFIYLVVLVVAVHIWLFFVLPYYNNTPFVQNTPAQVWYFFICMYFGLSAYQITSGYPTRILGNFLCRNYNLLSLVLFYGWRVIPFLTELRCLMDWIWTDTTLSLTHWLEVEDIYAQVYPTKCLRNRERDYPVARGAKTPWFIKYGAGGGILFLLIFIVWFPLILISLANTTSVKNPPSSMTVGISFSGFEPIFRMDVLSEELEMISNAEYADLRNRFSSDLNANSFFSNYRQEDIYIATVNGNSTGTWDISPPSRNSLTTSLTNDATLYITFTYSITRVTDNTQVTPTIENTYDLSLDPKNATYKTLRNNLIQQLDFQSTSPGYVQSLVPTYIMVPALSSPSAADSLLAVTGYGNATFLLQEGTIPNLQGTREWWEVDAQRNETDDATIKLYTFNERVASELLAPLSSYGIIGLYVSLVLVIGSFVRIYFSGISFQIMFTELPNVDRILKLCLDIYLVRESGEMELEEDLTAKLIFLYRSPETLIKVSKWKTD